MPPPGTTAYVLKGTAQNPARKSLANRSMSTSFANPTTTARTTRNASKANVSAKKVSSHRELHAWTSTSATSNHADLSQLAPTPQEASAANAKADTSEHRRGCLAKVRVPMVFARQPPTPPLPDVSFEFSADLHFACYF